MTDRQSKAQLYFAEHADTVRAADVVVAVWPDGNETVVHGGELLHLIHDSGVTSPTKVARVAVANDDEQDLLAAVCLVVAEEAAQ